MNRLNLPTISGSILSRPRSIALIAASPLIFGCILAPYRDVPEGMTVRARNDMVLMSTRDDFVAYVASTPQFCSKIDTRDVCFFDMDGRDSENPSRWRRIRYGAADMDGTAFCRYYSADLTGDKAGITEYVYDLFHGTGYVYSGTAPVDDPIVANSAAELPAACREAQGRMP
jgi:hypothetical protein